MMNILQHYKILLPFCILFATGCSSTPNHQFATSSDNTLITQSDVPKAISSKLNTHYQEWKGTPYQLGGLSKSGIDCSGFVQLTYRKVFNKQVPRTTEKLSDAGEEIALKEAKLGDLLVFKTGFSKRHVGIYIGNGKFIHASSSKGVMTSSINNPYWSDSYRQTRRIVDL